MVGTDGLVKVEEEEVDTRHPDRDPSPKTTPHVGTAPVGVAGAGEEASGPVPLLEAFWGTCSATDRGSSTTEGAGPRDGELVEEVGAVAVGEEEAARHITTADPRAHGRHRVSVAPAGDERQITHRTYSISIHLTPASPSFVDSLYGLIDQFSRC